MATLSEEQSIPMENILSPDVLRQLCFEPPQPLASESISLALRGRKVRQWQIELVVPGLVETLSKVSEPKEELDVPS
jgi:ribonuclease D